MLFNSLGFVVFLTIVLLLYYSRLSWMHKKIMLLFASYVFYAMWNPPLVILLWISTAVDWIAGNKLSKEENPGKRKMWLMLSLVTNLGFLAFFKYGGFLLENFTQLMQVFGVDFQAAKPDIILPMGISFYTFQTMSYTLDMYFRRGERARTLLDFSLYVTFFPQLVAGPIVRSGDLVSQFYEPKKATQRQFFWGMFLLTLGLFEKVVLADALLSETSDAVFSATALLHPLDAWAGTLAFSGQIFFDFAGYSTCAIGIALMMGFWITDNFKYPYGAIGFSDFWRRWHITLSTWLRDYLYIPLGGNRKGVARTYVNLMLTMLLGGLWHGASWTFVIWGALHGFYLMAERFFRERVSIRITPLKGIVLAFLTYFCVNVTWVFFRAADFTSAMKMLASMFFIQSGGEKVLQYVNLGIVYVLIPILFLVHYFMRNTSVKEVAAKMPAWVLGVVWALMFILIAVAQGTGEQFIYFQF
ncbi:MAG TPA: MBOAT family O-acyltransferase [Saprospiraceae bacterium]|nr:MBOAT family O-acyltransferase [Saprospiraceae bacterium]